MSVVSSPIVPKVVYLGASYSTVSKLERNKRTSSFSQTPSFLEIFDRLYTSQPSSELLESKSIWILSRQSTTLKSSKSLNLPYSLRHDIVEEWYCASGTQESQDRLSRL